MRRWECGYASIQRCRCWRSGAWECCCCWVALLLGNACQTCSCENKSPLQASLLEERDLGVLLSLVTLLLGIVSRSYEGYESLVPRIVRLLHRLNPETERDAAGRAVAPDRASVPPEYAYYGIPSPWLQVRAPSGSVS